MLSLSQASFAFSAPALAPQMQPTAIAMKAPGEIGVTPPCVPALFFLPLFGRIATPQRAAPVPVSPA